MKNMVLLIDTNVLLDVLANRHEFVRDSATIWKLCETEQAEGYISTLSFANIMYILRKELSPVKIEEIYRKLTLIFKIAEFNKTILDKSVTMRWKDFEDAVQSATAEQINADYIVTRNIRDYKGSKIPAFTPAELLARF